MQCRCSFKRRSRCLTWPKTNVPYVEVLDEFPFKKELAFYTVLTGCFLLNHNTLVRYVVVMVGLNYIEYRLSDFFMVSI
jgi:hypothetical protein